MHSGIMRPIWLLEVTIWCPDADGGTFDNYGNFYGGTFISLCVFAEARLEGCSLDYANQPYRENQHVEAAQTSGVIELKEREQIDWFEAALNSAREVHAEYLRVAY